MQSEQRIGMGLAMERLIGSIIRNRRRSSAFETISGIFWLFSIVVYALSACGAAARPIALSDIMALPDAIPIATIASQGVAFDVAVSPGLSHAFFPLPKDRLRVKSVGAKGDGLTDDTAAIEFALKTARPGTLVWFDPGVYRISHVLSVRTRGLVLAGRGATLHATETDSSSIQLLADHAAVVGLRFTIGATGPRGSLLQHHRIVATGKYNRIVANTIIGSKAAGIFLYGASNYIVAGNLVRATRADGIHSTNGAANGYIVENEIDASEDDGIAVVSYDQVAKAHDIIVERNHVHHLPWGRGLSVVGGERVTIRGNTVETIAAAAGIIVASESFYETPGSTMVYLLDNSITDIQVSLTPLNNANRTGHAAIEINAEDARRQDFIQRVVVRDNRVTLSRYGGLRIMGGVCKIALRDNSFRKVDKAPLTIVEPTCGAPLIACQGLTLDGKPWSNAVCQQ